MSEGCPDSLAQLPATLAALTDLNSVSASTRFYYLHLTGEAAFKTYLSFQKRMKMNRLEGDSSRNIAGVENEPVQRQRHLGFPDLCRASVHAPPFSIERTEGTDEGLRLEERLLTAILARTPVTVVGQSLDKPQHENKNRTWSIANQFAQVSVAARYSWRADACENGAVISPLRQS